MKTNFTQNPILNAVVNSLMIKYQYVNKTDLYDGGMPDVIELKIDEHDQLGEHLVIFKGNHLEYCVAQIKGLDADVASYRLNLIQYLVNAEIDNAVDSFGRDAE